MSETVNFESIKQLLKEKFEEQNNKLITDIIEVNAQHYADMDRQIIVMKKDVEKQISRINKRIVGWGWFVFILIIWSIIMFFAFALYHNNYLRTGKEFKLFRSESYEWESALKDAQTRGYSPITRGLSVDTKERTDAQKDSIINENQAGILRSIEKRNKK
jgi:hypothetical protein